jgi:putative NADH-flavin reductase
MVMKITVLGASGGCGQQLVTLGLQRGHEVTAVVRSASWQAPAGVKVHRGDLTNETFLRDALRGSDAVLSALGLRIPGLAPWNKPEQRDFLARSTPAIVAAMKAEGVKRLIAISAGGVGDSRQKVPAVFRAMIATTALRIAYAELEKMEAQFLASGLDVLIARPSGLTDGPATGQVKVTQSYTGRATISRADVATWMLDQLAQPAFPQEKTPMISTTGVP